MEDKNSNGFEEVTEKTSDKEKSLPLIKKIEILDKEIRLLHDFCLKSGLNAKEIQCCAEPLLKETKEVYRKKWWTKAFYLSLFIALIAFVLWYDPTYRYICVIGKLSSMKLLPYWDWTALFSVECFIDNPYYLEDHLTEEDCDICHNLTGVRLSNLSPDVMADDYLFDGVPVIITDATKDWPMDLKKFDTNMLIQLYLNDVNADQLRSCTFDAYDSSIHSVHSLFSRIQENNLDHYQGYWENCEANAAKSLRKFYKRPYCLPPMAESAAENWIFMSYSTSDPVKWNWENVAFGGSATWITQIKGKCKVVLTPQEPCSTICKSIKAVLKEGETLVFGNRLWYFKRRPVRNAESISLASVVSWDEIR